MFRSSLLLCASLFFLTLPLLARDSLERQVSKEFENKIVLLRNFYRGNSLQYDPSGIPLGSPHAGSWTVDGAIGITRISISRNRLRIYTRRFYLSSSPDGYDLFPSPRELMIESDFPNTISLDGVHEFWNRAFLTYHDHPAEIVPPFWKPCFEGKQTQTNPWCHFAPKVAPLFRFAPEPETAATPASAADSQPPLAQLVAQPTPGITVPRAKYTPDPEYSEEARTEQIQGLVIINLIVDKTGNPTNIRIVSPLGYGLDEKALNSIKKWRFEPGRKDGQPVATYATVEVAFHLSR